MSMITECPSCATTFRVTAEQLQAQQGLVRCGRCAHVFDGFETLAAQADDASFEPEAHQDSMRADAFVTSAERDAAPAQPSAVSKATTASAEVHKATEPLPIADKPPADETRTASVVPPQTQSPRRAVVYGASALVLMLIVQAIYFWRSEIAAYVPETKPMLAAACKPLGCNVRLPQRPAAMSIEASDMNAGDPMRPGLTTLTATLHNHASIALGYPALDVVLVNARDHTVARRIFVPSEYLDDKVRVAGVPANAEAIVKLYIETGDLDAAGFRLALIPAPAES